MTIAGPVVDDDRKGLMAAIANGTAMNGNSDEEYQSGKKNDKSRGETLVVVDPREEATER